MKILKKVAPDMGGVKVIFEDSLRVMSVPVTLGGPDAYTNGTQT